VSDTDPFSHEQHIAVGDLDIAYETFGDPADPPMLLVMGLGTQMVGWPEDLCQDLADHGYWVIRYDNRDIGRSTQLDHLPAPALSAMAGLALRTKRPPYSVADMADDAIGLLDALGLGTAHLVGVSMGGFIAQTAALAQPDRFRSLTLIMTSTGSRLVGQPKPGVLWNMAQTTEPTTPDEVVASTIEVYTRIGSPGFPVDREYLETKALLSLERSGARSSAGYQRQLAASIAQPNRTGALRTLRLPTLVIHGLSDPLVRPSGGLALAKTIPGAKFVGYDGMGHDLPRPLWADMAREIGGHANRADEVADPTTPDPTVGKGETAEVVTAGA
jgi:pimeloyl-ACP methyl ester carboxylesterase